MGSAHHFTEANIRPKLKENPSRGKGGNIKWTRNSGLKLATLNCDLVLESPWLSYGFYTSSHRWTFDQSLNPPRGKGDTERTKIQGSNPWPWTVTLTLSRHGWVINSAHRPTKVNIWPKFKNPSTGIGDTEQTQNSRLKPVTLNWTLTLGRHGWVLSSAHRLTEANIWPKFKENPSRGMRYGADTKFKAQTHDLDLWPWVGMADLWILHIDSLRRTFDQSFMKIFRRVQEIWSGQESVTEGHTDGQTDGQTDRWTDKGHFYNPPSASRRGIKKTCG